MALTTKLAFLKCRICLPYCYTWSMLPGLLMSELLISYWFFVCLSSFVYFVLFVVFDYLVLLVTVLIMVLLNALEYFFFLVLKYFIEPIHTRCQNHIYLIRCNLHASLLVAIHSLHFSISKYSLLKASSIYNVTHEIKSYLRLITSSEV